MKYLAACAALSIGVLGVGPVGALASTQAPSSISFSLISKRSGPHTIYTYKTLITFWFKTSGVTMDKHFPGKNISGHGHVAIYLDKIPSNAYSKKNLTNIANSNAPVPGGKNTYGESIAFTTPWIKLHKGHHHLLIALAQNNDVLYRLPTASWAITVK